MSQPFRGGGIRSSQICPPGRAPTERFLVQRICKLWTFRKGSIDNEQ